MKEKFIEERFPRWFVFGEHPDGSTVDISDGNHDVFQNVPREVAYKLMRARNEYVDQLVAIFLSAPDALYTYQERR